MVIPVLLLSTEICFDVILCYIYVQHDLKMIYDWIGPLNGSLFSNYTFKITIFVSMWNLGQFREKKKRFFVNIFQIKVVNKQPGILHTLSMMLI